MKNGHQHNGLVNHLSHTSGKNRSILIRTNSCVSSFSEVLKRRLTHIWFCWIIVVPIWLFGMLAVAIHTIGPIAYETFVYPLSFQIIGYTLTSLAPSSILIYFIYYQCKICST